MAAAITKFASYLALLSIIATSVHCAALLKDPQSVEPIRKVCQNERKVGERLQYGHGVETTYHPYLLLQPLNAIDTKNFNEFNVTVFDGHGSRNCSFTFELEYGDFLTPYQVSASTIIVLAKRGLLSPLRKPVAVVDTKTCESKRLNELDWSARWACRAHGCEEIHKENDTKVRLSYDLDGKQIGQPRPFLLQSAEYFSASPFPGNDPRSDNLVVKYHPGGGEYVVSLHDAEGRLIKRLLSLDTDRLRPGATSDINDSMFAYCWPEDDQFHCVQFDEFGNEIYRNSTTNQIVQKDRYAEAVGVRNLKNGGVALFTRTDTGIRVVEMRRGGISEKSYTAGVNRKAYDPLVVTDFDEADRRFTVRTVTYPEPAGGTFERCWYTFDVPSKFE